MLAYRTVYHDYFVTPFMSLSPATVPSAPHWNIAQRDFDALQSGLLNCPLPSLRVVHVSGPDARSFLQGQITVDVVKWQDKTLQLGGLCDPKGRLLAIFYLWAQNESVYLVLPADLAEGIARRLSMFVLRAKVKITLLPPDYTVHGWLAPAASTLVPASWPSQPGTWVALASDAVLANLGSTPSGFTRWLQIGLDASLTALATHEAAQDLWWWAHTESAHPMVFAATAGLFVPQAVNLEVLHGVNFKKGCYTGQEVVARSQYLGKLRRRLHVGLAPQPGPAPDIFIQGQPDPIGRIVMSVRMPQGHTLLSFECPTDKLSDNPLCAGGSDPGMALTVLPLPYPLLDPTA